MSNIKATTPEAYPMNGGDGTYSYTKNSYFQKAATSVAKSITIEAIENVLDIDFSSKNNNTFCIADLGCSVGPNTFIVVQNILNSVKLKYYQNSSRVPEFHIFFNDSVSNDFNTLFSSFPPEREYFASGVPGSFHGRLFPSSSIHFVHSSYAIHWLSKLPEELRDESSPAWNKGRIHYKDASDEVHKAYASQYAKDMASFLDARADELVAGGLMVLIMPAVPNDVPLSRLSSGVMFELLGCSLMDMAKEGIISEAEVDSFNLPVYAASPNEMKELVQRNGCFSIERMELNKPITAIGGPINGHALTMHLRAGMEAIISKHFGNKIIQEVFDRLYQKTQEFSDQVQSASKEGTQLVLILKRK